MEEEKEEVKKFDKDFKVATVKMVLEGKQSMASVARDIGVKASTLRNWKRGYLQTKGDAFPGSGYQTPLEAENTRLRRELARVTQERDFLKKAAAYFAAHEKKNIS